MSRRTVFLGRRNHLPGNLRHTRPITKREHYPLRRSRGLPPSRLNAAGDRHRARLRTPLPFIAGPMVRIHLPPPASPRTLGPFSRRMVSLAEAGTPSKSTTRTGRISHVKSSSARGSSDQPCHSRRAPPWPRRGGMPLAISSAAILTAPRAFPPRSAHCRVARPDQPSRLANARSSRQRRAYSSLAPGSIFPPFPLLVRSHRNLRIITWSVLSVCMGITLKIVYR